MACCGDVPTLETLAAATLLREYAPDLRVRVVNVVDLMALQPRAVHPHGLGDRDFDALFTSDRPVIFAFHGYQGIIHQLTYNRANHDNFHVRGYREEGTTMTPFDMVVLNNLDRYQLAFGCDPARPTAQRSGRRGRGALLDHHAAAQALCERTWAGHARGGRLALVGRLADSDERS
jgi:phosphoketolase